MSDRPPDEPEGFFGESVAAAYDDPFDAMNSAATIDPVVDFLVARAGGGRALELAIGTGRIGLPLAARGVEVHGIELSNAMVARLRAKPGGDRIPVTIGDMAGATTGSTYGLAYLVYNTIQNLTTQDAQVACFRNVARHLEAGGRFVIEVGLPDLQRLPPGDRYVVFDAGPTHWGVDEYDVATQGLTSHHFEIRGDDVRKSSGPFRYVWPSELDLMAELAGLRPLERWSGWNGEPFTNDSRKLVGVWEKPAG